MAWEPVEVKTLFICEHRFQHLEGLLAWGKLAETNDQKAQVYDAMALFLEGQIYGTRWGLECTPDENCSEDEEGE